MHHGCLSICTRARGPIEQASNRKVATTLAEFHDSENEGGERRGIRTGGREERKESGGTTIGTYAQPDSKNIMLRMSTSEILFP